MVLVGSWNFRLFNFHALFDNVITDNKLDTEILSMKIVFKTTLIPILKIRQSYLEKYNVN